MDTGQTALDNTTATPAEAGARWTSTSWAPFGESRTGFPGVLPYESLAPDVRHQEESPRWRTARGLRTAPSPLDFPVHAFAPFSIVANPI